MDEEMKKRINDAIAVLREECGKHKDCLSCPLERSSCGAAILPCDWEDID